MADYFLPIVVAIVAVVVSSIGMLMFHMDTSVSLFIPSFPVAILWSRFQGKDHLLVRT